jgi:H+/Cl- antiporter ClcA
MPALARARHRQTLRGDPWSIAWRLTVPGDATSIVAGWPIGREGRKIIAGAGIFSESGRLLVESRQTLILTHSGVPLSLAVWAEVPKQTPRPG